MDLRQQRRKLLLHVALPLVLPIGILILTTQVFPVLAEAALFVSLAVVVTSAWFTGWTGGIVTCLISFIGFDYFALRPFQFFKLLD
jgi:K+-sensing histidine kinase KdpD